jgi:hypothetical protein
VNPVLSSLAFGQAQWKASQLAGCLGTAVANFAKVKSGLIATKRMVPIGSCVTSLPVAVIRLLGMSIHSILPNKRSRPQKPLKQKPRDGKIHTGLATLLHEKFYIE